MNPDDTSPEPAVPALDPQPAAPWPDKPWLAIWVAPRKTMRAILNANPTRYVLLLAALAGASAGLDRAAGRAWGDTMGVPVAMLLGVVSGVVSGLISLYVMGAIYRWTGSLFGGVATSEETRAAIAWAALPTTATLVLLLVELLLYGGEIFLSEAPRIDANSLPLLVFALLQVILSFWSLFLLVKTVAEAHRINAWRGLIAVALPTVVLVVLLGGCVALSQGLTFGP